MSRIKLGSKKNVCQSMSSDTLTSEGNKNSSLLELWSALEQDGGTPEELNEFYERKPKMNDMNIAFSRKPRTEYDNIVNALTNLLLYHFVDKVEMEKCLAPEISEEKSDVEEETQGLNCLFEEPVKRNPSSESLESSSSRKSEANQEVKHPNIETINDTLLETSKRMNKNLTVSEGSKLLIINFGNSCILSDPSSQLSLHKEVFSSDSDSLEDVNALNYFSKYKGHDKNVLVEFKNGNKYEGRISCFMMEGEGTYTWKDGTKFKGTFISGIAQGRGHFSWPDNSWYNGEMKNNLRHGIGVCVVQKEEGMVCYFGKWKNGQRHGKGIILFGEYDWYDGKWKNDKMHGFGLRQYPTGSRYLGEWKYGKPHGEGTMVWSQQDTYTGMWRKGKMHGRGTYTWRTFRTSNFIFPLQNMYDGYWKNGKRHGPGRMLLASGAIISSMWLGDLKDGPGQIICKNGLILESPFLFSHDKLCNIGQPIILPPWNKWYYDFLLPYQDGIVNSLNMDCKSCYVYEEHEKLIGNISANINSWGTKRKMCLNNIPLLSAVETMPLWTFIEKSFEEQGAIKNDNGSLYVTEEVMANMSFEELWLRKVLSRRMPDINIVYQHYAKIGCEKPPEYNCFLLRIMLWQLCLDCGIEYSSFTLCSLDNKLSFGSYPFDVIPIFQMINYLLHLTYDICVKNKLVNSNIPGLWGGAFDYFISNFVLPGMKKKNILLHLCNLLPINELYYMYFKIGIPVTIPKILKLFSFDMADESLVMPPTLFKLLNLKRGHNLINPDGSIVFEEEIDKISKVGKIGNSQDCSSQFIEGSELKTLGDGLIKRLLISSCLRNVEEKTLLDEYEVSFLEFCQFILALLKECKRLTPNLTGVYDDYYNFEEESFTGENEIGSFVASSDRNNISNHSKTEGGIITNHSQNSLEKDGKIVQENLVWPLNFNSTKDCEEKRSSFIENSEERMLDGTRIIRNHKGNYDTRNQRKYDLETKNTKKYGSNEINTSSWNGQKQIDDSNTTFTFCLSPAAEHMSKTVRPRKEWRVYSNFSLDKFITNDTENTCFSSRIKEERKSQKIFPKKKLMNGRKSKVSKSELKQHESTFKGLPMCHQSVDNYSNSREDFKKSLAHIKRLRISKYKLGKLLHSNEMNCQTDVKSPNKLSSVKTSIFTNTYEIDSPKYNKDKCNHKIDEKKVLPKLEEQKCFC